MVVFYPFFWLAKVSAQSPARVVGVLMTSHVLVIGPLNLFKNMG